MQRAPAGFTEALRCAHALLTVVREDRHHSPDLQRNRRLSHVLSLARARVTVPLLALAVLAALAAAGPAAAAQPCWKRLVNDWFDGRIDQVYPIGCYREALRNLPADVDIYSSARDDINRALQSALLDRGGGGKGAKGGGGTTPATTGSSPQTGTSGPVPIATTSPPATTRAPTDTAVVPPPPPATTTRPPRGTTPPTTGRDDRGAIGRIGPNKADEFPLPLIILAAIAGLLVAAGAAGLLARRMQARRTGDAGDGA